MSFEANYELGYPSYFDELFSCKPSEECKGCTFDCPHNPDPKYHPQQ